jgi:hypothetical protein
MDRNLQELIVNLWNMVFMHKLKRVSVLNMVEAPNIVPGRDGDTKCNFDNIKTVQIKGFSSFLFSVSVFFLVT